MDSDLSGGQRYPSFEQLGPVVLMEDGYVSLSAGSSSMKVVFCSSFEPLRDPRCLHVSTRGPKIGYQKSGKESNYHSA